MLLNTNHAHSGYYIYKDQPYFTREDVFDAMLANEDYSSHVEYYYNDHVFDQFDWSKEPDVDISTLYKMRAQQLRDKYKYVILGFSGGSDSTQMLWSFLKNNIFIDEIQISHCNTIVERMNRNEMLNDNELSMFLEYNLAAKPMLKKVSELSPNTKITEIDSSVFLVKQLSNNENFKPLGNHGRIRHSYPRLTSALGPNNQWWNMYIEQNVMQSRERDSVCIVRGMEKPAMHVIDDTLYFNFTDQTMVTTASFNRGEIDAPYITEDFYWSPDAPLIPIKQSHLVKKRFETDKETFEKWSKAKFETFLHTKQVIFPRHHPGIMIDRILNETIYPDWNPNTFVAPKPTVKSPEFKLFEKTIGKHNTEFFLKEFRIYKEYKYRKILDKTQFYKTIVGKSYQIGKLEKNYV